MFEYRPTLPITRVWLFISMEEPNALNDDSIVVTLYTSMLYTLNIVTSALVK